MDRENLPALGDLAKQINAEHEASQQAMSVGLEHAMKAGALLAEVKTGLAHGEWQTWVKESCTFGERTARGYLRLARELPKLDEGKRQRVAVLSFKQAMKILSKEVVGLHELSAEQLGEVITAAEAGDDTALGMAKWIARRRLVEDTFRVADRIKPKARGAGWPVRSTPIPARSCWPTGQTRQDARLKETSRP